MVRQAPVICVMAPPIHLGAWSMALMYSGTSDNGHSEERTTSQTACPLPKTVCISTSEIRTPLTSEQWTNVTSRTVITRTDKDNNSLIPRPSPAKRSLYAGGMRTVMRVEETSPEVDVWGEWHQNETPQCSRSPAPARPVYGARDAL